MFLMARNIKTMKELPGMVVTDSRKVHHHSLAWIGVLNVYQIQILKNTCLQFMQMKQHSSWLCPACSKKCCVTELIYDVKSISNNFNLILVMLKSVV